MTLAPLPTTLDESVGWITVLGFGFVFTILTVTITNMEKSMLGKSGSTSEEFATAGRNLGMGLVAADIVSQWTWAATLLMSSNMCWRVGISGSGLAFESTRTNNLIFENFMIGAFFERNS